MQLHPTCCLSCSTLRSLRSLPCCSTSRGTMCTGWRHTLRSTAVIFHFQHISTQGVRCDISLLFLFFYTFFSYLSGNWLKLLLHLKLLNIQPSSILKCLKWNNSDLQDSAITIQIYIKYCDPFLSFWDLAESEKEKSRMSASLLVPLHSNQWRSRGNVEGGKQANNHQRKVYLRRRGGGGRRKKWRANTKTGGRKTGGHRGRAECEPGERRRGHMEGGQIIIV